MAWNFFQERNRVKWVGIRLGLEGQNHYVAFQTSANVVVYTVPADQVFLLYNWHFGVRRNLSVNPTLRIRNDAAVIKAIISSCSSNVGMPGTNDTANLLLPMEIPAAWDFHVNSGGVQCSGYLHGVLIDV